MGINPLKNLKTRWGGIDWVTQGMFGAFSPMLGKQMVTTQEIKNRSGYATEKPIKLLNKIISMASNKGGLVADFFCGCGTTISSAEGLGRRWIGCDVSKEAGKTIRKRMARDHKIDIEISNEKNLTKEEVLKLPPF